jgi:glucose-1-phosphate cytidylyltransferase
MKVVILAGGLGTRLAEETEVKPKPMVEIGGRPILWHIMKSYAAHGFCEFFVALGYKGEVIKRYFVDMLHFKGSMSLDFVQGEITMHQAEREDWIVHLMDTGLETGTGGRIKRLEPHLQNQTFMMTYGDGVSNVNMQQLLAFHRAHGKTATITAVRPPARFGGLELDGDFVSNFKEKPQIGEGWINGGFLVFEPRVLDYLQDDSSSLETDALEKLAGEGELVAYRHDSFWQCMDTLRDKRLLESLWQSGRAPWQTWSGN